MNCANSTSLTLRKYTQTSIFSYVQVRKVLTLSQEKTTPRMQTNASSVRASKNEKKKPLRKSRKILESSNLSLVSDSSVSTSFEKNLKTEKRKLPAPIFTDDEDSGEDCCNSKSTLDYKSTGSSFSPKQQKVMVSCNKSSTLSVLSKEQMSTFSSTSTKQQSSTSTSSNSPSLLSCSKKAEEPLFEVLENATSSEVKKLNYMNLKTIREFFVNVNNSENLKHLLTEDNRSFLMNFFNVDKNYQFTCTKLFLWKQMWYNIFNYTKQIGLVMNTEEVVKMYEFLKDNNYIETDILKEKTCDLLNLLQLKDLKKIQVNLKLQKKIKTKEALIEEFLKTCRTQATLTSDKSFESLLRDDIARHLGLCFKLSKRLYDCLYTVFLLNTFTNSDILKPQDYFSTVVYFNMVFPKFDVENYTVFDTVEEFQTFVAAKQLRVALEFACEKKEWLKVFEICEEAFRNVKNIQNQSGKKFNDSKPPFFEKFTACSQYISIINVGYQHLTKTYFYDVKSWLEYLIGQQFSKNMRGFWFCQLSLIFTQYIKDYEEAAKLLIKAFENEKDNLSEVQLHELAYRGKVLNKKTYNLPKFYHDKIAKLSPPTCDRNWSYQILPSRLISSNQPGQRATYEHKLEDGDVLYCTVEQLALEYYKSEGFPQGVHCEGNLIHTAFCLFFWDIIYDFYVKGTFVSSMQVAPLDINTKYFYLNRQTSIDKRLKQIECGWSDHKFGAFLSKQWELHSKESSLCKVDAVAANPLILLECLKCIGRDKLAKIFERLVKNFRVYRSGFPDLVVWNVETKKAKFVEIKSENDKLSIKQKIWLNFFRDIHADAEVCHVLSKGSKKYQVLTAQQVKQK